MKPELLMVGPMMPHVMAALDHDFNVHRLWQAANRTAALAAARNARAIATDGHLGADAPMMDALPQLEIVACYGVGVDAIDLSHAASRGVLVSNTPDVLTDDVANLAIALLLAVTRRVTVADRYVREGRWSSANMDLTQSVVGKRLGILGLGRIGRAIARRAEALGCTVCYTGRRSQTDQPYPYHDNLTGLARSCDYLVVCCPGGAATHHLVGQDVLAVLGPEGVLINVARGAVVDEAALVRALTGGQLGGAGLDVFADEPRVPAALLELDNVVLQPHMGSATVETRRAMGDLVVDNLRAHFAGRPLLTPVS